MEHLLIMHYDERLHDAERSRIEQWIRQCDDNNKLYKDTVLIWKHAKTPANNRHINIEWEWEKLCHIITDSHW